MKRQLIHKLGDDLWNAWWNAYCDHCNWRTGESNSFIRKVKFRLHRCNEFKYMIRADEPIGKIIEITEDEQGLHITSEIYPEYKERIKTLFPPDSGGGF